MRRYFVQMLLFLVIGQTGGLMAQPAVGYEFLRDQVGARPSALAGAFVGIVGDINNVAYNPAGLSYLTEKVASISYTNHILDFNTGFLAFAKPVSNGTAAIALNFVDFGQFERRDETNQALGEFGSSALAFSLSYATGLIENLSAGGSVKYVRFDIDNFSASALAADVGLVFSVPSKDLNIGFAVQNIGANLDNFIDTKDDLPTSLQLGASKMLEHLPVILNAALVKYKYESLDFRIGAELLLTEQLQARLGYNSQGRDQKIDTDRDRVAGFSFGLGFKINKFDIGYSLRSFGEVGSPNQFTLVGRF